jgi:enoyl-CoA hydratase/carnithine racemase
VATGIVTIAFGELRDLVECGRAGEELNPLTGAAMAVVTPEDGTDPSVQAVVPLVASLPCVLIAAPGSGEVLGPLVDVVAQDDADTIAIGEMVRRTPLACTAYVVVLRGASSRAVDDGLVMESVAYSMLQGGPEFETWRASRPLTPRPVDTEPVLVHRDADILRVTLHRPQVRNALDRFMRDALASALEVGAADPSIELIVLDGAGPAFCSGGDLDEFGSRPDPATAHVVRLTRSPARLLAHLSQRVEARVHGPCRGSGVELPAFAHRVVADPASTFGLPELSLGLIPGAGGTVSLTRRIGRHRTALLGLTGRVIDAPTALAWGLVDQLAGVAPAV